MISISNRSQILILIFLYSSLFLVGCLEANFNDDPAIYVEPRTALIDEPVNIVLSNFEPGEIVKVFANMRYSKESTWESWATFLVDQNGQVDINTHAPLDGTYGDIDGMGLFWSMEENEEIDSSFSREIIGPIVVDIVVENNDTQLVSTQIERLVANPDVIRREVRADGLVGTLFLPGDDRSEYPAVIVLSESIDSIGESKAALIASHGYASLALYYFRGMPNPGDLTKVPLEYFETAISWLKEQERVNDDRIGIIGGSRGGELALLLGSMYADIKAVIAYVPSGVVFQGIDSTSWEPQPAWLVNGVPIPYVPFDNDDFQIYVTEQTLNVSPIALARLYRNSFEKVGIREEVTIPVENTNGPLLLISGQDDQMWPSNLFSEMVVERLNEKEFPYYYQHLSYEYAGHGISLPYWPTTKNEYYSQSFAHTITIGGNAKDDAFASIDSWEIVLEFLHRNLGDTR